MKGKQMAMESLLREADANEEERRRREWAREKERTDAVIRMLDGKYARMNEQELKALPAGAVVIIGQRLFRNDHYSWHFYRTVMTFFARGTWREHPVFVQADTAEWPDIPPWAQVVGHEDEPHEIQYIQNHVHWFTGEIGAPVVTWWKRKWGM